MPQPAQSAPHASTSKVFEYSSPDSDATATDALFLERLETFMDRSLADIKAFSEREGRSFEEVLSGSLIGGPGILIPLCSDTETRL